ncbi:biotin transporter BioY [Undibacter mobilis]|uniref:Biotin transporter n=1 Tax=Undibacter mobilis TaxID=2292256 RepID=A0A371B8R4_9BRAD|nr:biotin transporter BioY [Undibacter mobilis]RDV03995.1 biotin transporter BioY [Undibacter mobilis]
MKRLFKSAAAVATKDDIGSRLMFGFAAVVVGSLLLTASARTQIPFWPVPMTMQTMAVIVIGMTLGSRLGLIVVAAYVLEGLMGLPVFANTPARGAGLAYLMGPTGGYLAGFCVAAYVSGWLAERGFGHDLFKASLVNIIGTLIILTFGYAWLAHLIGPVKAYAAGVHPFLLSSLVKIGLGAVLAVLIARSPLKLRR